MDDVLKQCFRHDTDERVVVFRYATNMAHCLPVTDREGETIELTLRRLTRLAYEAGRMQGVQDVQHLLTPGKGPYR